MKKRTTIIFLLIICILLLFALSSCVTTEEPEAKILTVYAQGDFYVNANIVLTAKWQNGETAENAVFILSEYSPFVSIANNSMSCTQPGKYSISASADGISSQPIEILVKHSTESLTTSLTQILSEVDIDVAYNLNLTNSNLTAQTTNTDISTIEDGKLLFSGIGQTELIIKNDKEENFLTLPVSSINSFTEIILEQMKSSGAIAFSATQATQADMAATKELNLAGKLYNHRGKEFILQKFKSLEKLYLSDCNLRTLNALNAASTLQHLDIGGNLISSLTPLEKYASLQYLDVSDNCLSNDNFELLTSLNSLHTLKVGGNELPDTFDDIVSDLSINELDKESYRFKAPETLSTISEDKLATFNSVKEYQQNYVNKDENTKVNVIIDLSKTQNPSDNNTAIIIPSKARNVEIIGEQSKTFDTSITVQTRTNTLLLIIENLDIIAPDNNAGISSPEDSYLKLIIKGQNKIQAGSDSHGIKCGFIEIIGDIGTPSNNSLEVYGGNGAQGRKSLDTKSESNSTRKGGSGNEGGSGIFASLSEGLVVRRVKELKIKGGNGGTGGTGGKYIGQGLNPNTWLKKNGDGGRGGNGGNGYTGNGQHIIISSVTDFSGGNGGAGGAGAHHVDPTFRGQDGNPGSDGVPIKYLNGNY